MSVAVCGIGSEGDREDGETDEEGIAEMEGGHGSILVTEFILCPDAPFAAVTVDGVDEAVAARFRCRGTVIGRIGEETRWHTRPQCKHDERNQVTRCHCSSSCLE